MLLAADHSAKEGALTHQIVTRKASPLHTPLALGKTAPAREEIWQAVEIAAGKPFLL